MFKLRSRKPQPRFLVEIDFEDGKGYRNVGRAETREGARRAVRKSRALTRRVFGDHGAQETPTRIVDTDTGWIEEVPW